MCSSCQNRKQMIQAMYTLSTKGKTISIFPSLEVNAPIIYLNTFSDEDRKVYEAVQVAGCPQFTLVSVSDLDRNHDMVSWNSPPVFKNADACISGADDHLRLLTQEIIPTVEKEIAGVPCWRGITGYSLAGLFALYAIYQTDLFSRVGSMSGSLWFPSVKEYIFSHEPKRWPDCIYFSLGDKESKTRNPILRSVQQNTEEIHAFYQGKGIDIGFQQNPGNHYNHDLGRTAAGLCWLLSR